MSDIPSWARVGAKVVCVDPTGSYIAEGAVYEISWVGIASGIVDLGYGLSGVSVHLAGVNRWSGVPYAIERFKPLITLEHHMAVHFERYLHQGSPVGEAA